ncbi:MAG: 2-polyprenylphenol 6-hydroxylase [bacterium]
MPIPNITRTYKNVNRVRQIINVLIKHGFGHIVEQLNLSHILSFTHLLKLKPTSKIEKIKLTVAERVRLVLEELGPTFVKFGQLLSTRPDLIPPDFIKEFSRLQDNVPPVDFQLVKEQIETEFELPLDNLFTSFDTTPFAAASISQVHLAHLEDGSEVVVKIQRPKIESILDTDISILLNLAHLLERYMPETRVYRPVDVIEELPKIIRRELDFTIEASNLERFRANFKDEKGILVPKVFWNLTSKRVLTQEKIKGIPVDNIEILHDQGQDLPALADRICRCFLKQVLEDGFFHADPHPGNILVTEDGKISFIDFGMVDHLTEETIEGLGNIFFAILNKNYDKLVNEYLTEGFINDETDIELLKRDLIDFIEPYYGKPLRYIEVGTIFKKLNEIALRHGVKIRPDLVLLGKAMVMIEGNIRRLDPDIDLLAIGKPFALNLLKKRIRPKRLFKLTYKSLNEFVDLFRILPNQVKALLRKTLNGELEIEFVHVGLDNLIREMDRSSNRLAFALIISALIIGSSLIILSSKGPFFLGYPSLGILGFVSAGIMGIWLIIAIIRSGRL